MKIKIFGRELNITRNLPAPSDDGGWSTYLTGKGYAVTANTALKVAAVIRCVDLIAKDIASFPLNLFRKTDTGREKAEDHPLYKLLYRLPNPLTTAYDFWHMYVCNLLMTIGAHAKIVRDRNGFPRQLWNIPTANVKRCVNTYNGERYIIVNLGNGKSETLHEGEYMYTPGMRLNSDADPSDPMQMAADVLGLTMALNGFAKDYFENGSNLGGFLEYPQKVSQAVYDRFKDSWMESYGGVVNQHKIAFLESGYKFNSLTQNPTDSQALESRKFAVIEICRFYGVPPHKAFELDKATFNNIEQINIEYVQEALTSRCTQLEQTIYKDLLTTKERDIYYAKFNMNGLLRGDIASRSTFYHNMRNDGIMNANEIRELEDMNNISEEAGGTAYLCNGNLITLKTAMNTTPKSTKTGV